MESFSPEFFREQQDADLDPSFRDQLVQISKRFLSQKKRVIFISRAWPYEDDRLQVNEGWSETFPDLLYDHLQLLGFQVILDKKDLGVGNQLDDAMEKSVDKADHVLLLVTRTYIHKATKDPTTGVAREVHYITHKVEAMDSAGINGWVIAGKRRFVLPLAFNDTRGFPIADSHPGIATIFVQTAGYRQALIDLAEKVYGVEPGLLREVVPSSANVLIQAVKKCYSERKYISRPFHDEPLPIEKGYVRLAIVKEAEQREKMKGLSTQEDEPSGVKLFEDKRLTSFEQIYGAKEPVDIADIFKPYKVGENETRIPKRLLVLGRAGIGKSTLCQKMAHQWAAAESEAKLWEESGQEKFKLVVWVPLRNLLDYPENATLSDVILKECVSKDHTGEKFLSKEAVLRGLKELKTDDVLFVCDGYDEVAGRTTPLIDEILSKENVFVTTRPHGIHQYLTSDNARPFDRKFENIGFLDEDIENYVRVFFVDEEQGQNYAETLIQFLKTHPNIWGLAHIPINLMLICVAWKDNFKRFNLKEIKNVTITDLYYGLLVNLARRYLDKSKVKGLNDFTPEDILEHEKCKPVLAVLSELAFQQMDNESLLIPGKALTKTKLRKHYPDVSSLRDDVIHFGVLSPTSPETSSEKTEFYFVHLTFQEFLAAFSIANKLRANDGEIKQYILMNKYSRRHEMVWWFVAGLLKDEIEVLERFFDILEAEPRDLAHLYHEMLMMRCMDECQLKVTFVRKKAYLIKLGKLIECGLREDSLFYSTLAMYLNLSEIVFSQPEIVGSFVEFLKKKDYSYKHNPETILRGQAHLPKAITDCLFDLFDPQDPQARFRDFRIFGKNSYVTEKVQHNIAAFLTHGHSEVRAAAVDFFAQRYDVSDVIQKSIVNFLRDQESVVRIAAVNFFVHRSEVSEEIQRSIMGLLLDPKDRVSEAAHNFFSKRKEVPEEIQRRMVDWFHDPEMKIRKAAHNFFSKRKNVSEDIQRNIAAYFNDDNVHVGYAALVFFDDRHEVSEEIQKSIAGCFNNRKSYVSVAAVNFFSKRKEVAEAIQRSLADLLKVPEEEVVSAALNFFSKRQEIPAEVQRWFLGTTANLISKAIYFFREHRGVSEEIQSRIAGLLETPEENIKSAACAFFEKRADASEAVQSIMVGLLSDYHYTEQVFRFFHQCHKVSEAILNRIADLLKNPSWRIRELVLRFLSRHPHVNISEEIQKKIALWMIKRPSQDDIWMAAAIFFWQRQKVSEEIFNSISSFLHSSSVEVRKDAIRFYCHHREMSEEILSMMSLFSYEFEYEKLSWSSILGCQEVPEGIQRKMAESLICFDGVNVRGEFVDFFCTRQAVSEEIQRKIVYLYTMQCGWHRAEKFFKGRKEIFPAVFERVGSLWKRKEKGWLKTFLETVSINQMHCSLQTLDGRAPSEEFLIAVMVKLLMSNAPFFRCDKTSLQIGNQGAIHFKNEKKMGVCVKNFKKVFAEFTGLNFDESEEPVEVVSEARVVSRVGLLPAPAPAPNSNNDVLPEKSEAQKPCVIC